MKQLFLSFIFIIGFVAFQKHLMLQAQEATLERVMIPNKKKGGIRDPHILCGEDGKTFYMVATDMYTHKNGWAHNPGIVMPKSDDLINWTHSIIQTFANKIDSTKNDD